MYQYENQEWKALPKILSDSNREILALRIAEYVKEHRIPKIVVVFHGGEPLLAGVDKIVETANWIREAVGVASQVDFSMQTNGVLLTADALDIFERNNIGVSLSLDGPAHINDKHRLSFKGESTYEASVNALHLLQKKSVIFSGIIAVIDPFSSPREIFSFFEEYSPPAIDLLLPDANYMFPPPARSGNMNLYKDWLIEAFDIWFYDFPHLKVRTFDSMLASLLGLPNETDAFGLGDVSLLTIETSGKYHDLDVLKIVPKYSTDLDAGDLASTTISQALLSQKVADHRFLLTQQGLCDKCQNCNLMSVCGGGSVPHRYDQGTGFANPSVYCEELYALINHAKTALGMQLESEIKRPLDLIGQETSIENIPAFENEETSSTVYSPILQNWGNTALQKFSAVIKQLGLDSKQAEAVSALRSLPESEAKRLLLQPSVVLWTEVMYKHINGEHSYSIDGDLIEPDPEYLRTILGFKEQHDEFRVHRNDAWLRMPFGKKIFFETEKIAKDFDGTIRKAFQIVHDWNKNLLNEMKAISPEIQYIVDLTADPDKIVSFSDNTVPGALYVSIRQHGRYINEYDLADSLIHEHRHQKLYLLQRANKLVEADFPLVKSPWREDLRPPSGLFHAVYVFTHLFAFWKHLTLNSIGDELRERAMIQCEVIDEKLVTGFMTLPTIGLTPFGKSLALFLERKFLMSKHLND